MSVNPRPPKILAREVPLFIVFVFMAAGMIMARECELGVGAWLAPSVIAWVVAFLCFKGKYKRGRTSAIAFLSFSCGLVIFSGWISLQEYRSIGIEKHGSSGIVYHEHRSGAGNTIVHLQLTESHRTNRVLGIVLDKEFTIRVGDTIAFNKHPVRIEAPANDFEFDQASYYRTLGISHRVFLRQGEVSIRPNSTSNSCFAETARHTITSKVNNHLTGDISASILFAMLFGERSHLASETKRIYSESGAMHILAISGLHIGIIASLLLLLLGNPSRRRYKWIAYITGSLIIGALWLYVWLVGMPASASRAAGMFTIYIVGGIFRKRTHPLNILGATGIIALASNPMIIGAVGFQFSYLALIGIVTIGLPLYRTVNFRSKVVQYLWATVAISIGAQFFLLPLLAFYFNEIATMSIISSLFAIPAAYVIVCSGILLTVSSFCLAPVAGWIGILLDKFIQLLTQGLTVISNTSWSTIPKIYLTGPEVIVLLVLLSTISLRVATGQVFWSKFTAPVAVIFLVVHASTYSIRMNAASITLYAIGEQPAFEVIYSGTSYHYGLNQMSGYALTNIERNRLSNYVRETQFLQIDHAFTRLTGFRLDSKPYPIAPRQLPLKINIQ